MRKLFAVYELVPDKKRYDKRLMIIRERKEDCEEILKCIEKSNINFDYYVIEELKEQAN